MEAREITEAADVEQHHFSDDKKGIPEDEDALRLGQMGYVQDMNRNFSILALLGICFSLTSSWFGFSVGLITGISSGGTAMSTYGILFLGAISACVGVSLSELSSAMPNAGGQYFWTNELAPSKYANFASFLTGWFAWLGGIFVTCSSALGLGQALVGMWQLAHPDIVLQPWHSVLAYELINGLAFFFNCYGNALPKITTLTMWISLVSFITIFITVPACSSTHTDPKFVFATFTNSTGWASDGLAFLVGLINPNWLFVCLDSATHLAEEVKRPEKAIPIAIMGTVGVGFITSWLYCITMFFSVSNLDDILSTATGVPILELYNQALRSKAGAIVLESLVLATGFGCQIASHTYQSRLCWSFARDRGLPMNQYLSKVHPTLGVPLWAHSVSCALVSLLGLLYLGSSTAFNSFVTASIVLLYISYSIPIICLLLNGRNTIKHGPFWLSSFGLICNWIVLIWTVFTIVIYSFPSIYPVAPTNMNYVSLVYGLVVMVIITDWFVRGKKSYRGQETRHEELDAGTFGGH